MWLANICRHGIKWLSCVMPSSDVRTGVERRLALSTLPFPLHFTRKKITAYKMLGQSSFKKKQQKNELLTNRVAHRATEERALQNLTR